MGNRSWRLRLREAAFHPISVCLLLAGAVLGAFWPVVHCGFIDFDDPDYVTSNATVLNGITWEGVGWAFRTYHASNWHPLTWLSHMLDADLFGSGPAGPHCVNLLLHVANSVLLFFLLRRMTGARWKSAFVAALFGLHPLHVESVAWISERKDVLSTCFWMLTLLAYARYVGQRGVGTSPAGSRLWLAPEHKNLQQPAWSPGTASLWQQGSRFIDCPAWWYLMSLFLFALGLLSKPMLVTLPFVLLLLDFWPFQRITLKTLWPRLREKLPFFALSAIACLITVLAQRQAIQPLDALPLSERIDNCVVSYLRYLGKMAWPAGLALPYPYPGRWSGWLVIAAAVVLAVTSLAVVLARRRFPYAFTGWFWFLGTLVPVIGLVQVGSQSMADRYTYVPLIGIFLLLTWSAAAVARRQSLASTLIGVVAVSLLAACALLTRQQAGWWRDTETLFRHATVVTQRNYVALSSLGVSLSHRGKKQEAIECYLRALEICPNFADAMNNMGVVLAGQGNDEALIWYHRALQLSPGNPSFLFNLANELAYRKQYPEAVASLEAVLISRPDDHQALNNLGNALKGLGRLDEAILRYRAGLSLAPRDLQIQKNLAEALMTQGKVNEAIPLYRQALKQAPEDPALLYGLGLALALQGQWDRAIPQYQVAARLMPKNAEVQYNLGYALRSQGRLDEALVHLRQALQLRPDFPLAHYNLACVLADKGLCDEAITSLNEALRLKPDYEEAARKLRTLAPPTRPRVP
jgi:tetratricopeptide (TPR) repeat protein